MTPEQITLAGVLVAIGVAGAAGKWVFGWIYDDMVKDRDWWRDRALAGTALAEIATEEAEKVKT
jgi:predicted MFS family arabinose efflux permease